MTSYYASCPPTHATPANLDRPSIGGRTVRLARLAGIRFDPWQIGVARTIGETLPDGRFAYPLVVLIVPRRAGKTLLCLFHMLSVLIGAARRRAWYTLHRREIGAALWRDELFPLLEQSRLNPLVSLRRSNGSEAVTVRRLASTLRLFAPTGEALRSQNADVVTLDEAREFTIDQGERLEAAVRPAQARRPQRQLIVASSAPGPDAPATYLARYRDLGRAAVDTGRADGVAYFEWSLPAGLDPDDPTNWPRAHPALAAGQITVEALAPDFETMRPEVFRAEYLGLWHADPAGTRTIDADRWNACHDPAATLAGARRPVVAVDLTGDRTRAAVAVAAPTAPGRVHLELVAVGAGATWALDAALAVARRLRCRLVLDTYGPAGNLIAPARATLGEHRVIALTTGDAARACADLLDLIAERRLTHLAQPELDDQIGAARARRRGDAWLWDRTATGPEVCAATWAAALAAAPPPPKPAIARSGAT